VISTIRHIIFHPQMTRMTRILKLRYDMDK